MSVTTIELGKPVFDCKTFPNKGEDQNETNKSTFGWMSGCMVGRMDSMWFVYEMANKQLNCCNWKNDMQLFNHLKFTKTNIPTNKTNTQHRLEWQG